MTAGQLQGDGPRGFDPEAVADVDFGRAVRLLGRHWWAVAAGWVLGAIVGFAVALGHGQTFKATATVYLGLPYASGGGIALQALQTNPSAVDQIVHSLAVDRRVARACKTPVASFDKGISVEQQTGSFLRNRQTAYTTIGVLARKPKPDACAAAGLAREVVARFAPYARSKIAAFRTTIAADDREIARTAAALASAGTTAADRLVLLVQLRGLQSDRATTKQLLIQAVGVEEPRLLGRARATRVTGRTPRASTFVAGLIGALLAIVAILVWGRRRTREVGSG